MNSGLLGKKAQLISRGCSMIPRLGDNNNNQSNVRKYAPLGIYRLWAEANTIQQGHARFPQDFYTLEYVD
jgi:hypothetical protein